MVGELHASIRAIPSPQLRAALVDTPVVLVVGARQVGKSTLVQQVISTRPGVTYLTLDDLTVQSVIPLGDRLVAMPISGLWAA